MGKIIFKPFDFLFLALSIAAVAFSILALKNGNGKKSRLVVEADGKEYIYPLDEEKTLEINGAIGISLIRIENGKAYFENSPCPGKLCVKMPAVKENNDWAACMPNKVFIRVEN